MNWYMTRLCWNQTGWQRPDGTARETDSFVAVNGFGLEEWLFSPLLRGAWCYGFVQAVQGFAGSAEERELNLLLYSLRPPGPNHERFFVGQMHCQVLTAEEATTAYRYFVENGTMTQMRNEVTEYGRRGANAGYFTAEGRTPFDFFQRSVSS